MFQINIDRIIKSIKKIEIKIKNNFNLSDTEAKKFIMICLKV